MYTVSQKNAPNMSPAFYICVKTHIDHCVIQRCNDTSFGDKSFAVFYYIIV